MDYKIRKIDDSNITLLRQLVVESKNEGFSFVQRTVDEWKNGINNFSSVGEVLFGVFSQNECIAIGGLNIDPYLNDPTVGRVRHLYVSPSFRRKGIATALLKKIIEKSKKCFKILRLSTHATGAANPEADKFYESMGFIKSDGLNQTHFFIIDKTYLRENLMSIKKLIKPPSCNYCKKSRSILS